MLRPNAVCLPQSSHFVAIADLPYLRLDGGSSSKLLSYELNASRAVTRTTVSRLVWRSLSQATRLLLRGVPVACVALNKTPDSAECLLEHFVVLRVADSYVVDAARAEDRARYQRYLLFRYQT